MPLFPLFSSPRRLVVSSLALFAFGVAGHAETVIQMSTAGGLRFDPPRLLVRPGDKLKLVIENVDDMAHNFVLVQPGARMEVVEAAMQIPITPDGNYVPKSDKILQASPMIVPKKTATMEFNAPSKEGIYPYVCTFPGHGIIMYGAMYVTKGTMPPLAADLNVPEIVRDAGDAKNYHAFTAAPPYLYRIFMRDAGPASIAVCLPGGQNYCWDAGACRLRYAWSGAFLDPMGHWTSNGDGYAEVKGRVYYRAEPAFPLHFGTKEQTPNVQFRGYRLVERYPEFRFEMDGVEVRELIKPLHHGSGFETAFSVASAKGPVLYTFDPAGGAAVTSSAGTIANGVLTLTPEQAKKFTLTFTEIPGREPLRYWSMNDTLNRKKVGLTDDGVRGRAASFDGTKAEYATGISTTQLTAGSTFAAWIKAAPFRNVTHKDGSITAATNEQVALGALGDAGYLLLGWHLAGSPGFGLAASTDGVAMAAITTDRRPDNEWHHIVLTHAAGTFTLYWDGQPVGTASGDWPAKAPVVLGSAGGSKFGKIQMDEARLDDRAYTAAEVTALFNHERPQTSTPAAQ